MNAPCVLGTPSNSHHRAKTRDAWTAFWQTPGQVQCVADAPAVQRVLTRHWASFAASLQPGERVLDLGCGAGAVARALLTGRRDVRVTGVDFAKIPLVIHAQVELLCDTAMESLPFADASFAAAVSQFGFEYAQIDAAAKEMARVLAPGGKLSFLAHHAGSAVVGANRARLSALTALLNPAIRTAFCAGDSPALHAQLSALRQAHAHDALIAELARTLPSRLGRAPRERMAIWTAVEDALAPERYVLEALRASCIAPDQLDDWLGPLREGCALEPVSVLREPDGAPIAWRIAGVRTDRP